MTMSLTTAYTGADFDAPAGVDPCAPNTIDLPHVNGQVGCLAAHTMLWLLCVYSILPPTSRTPVAIPDTPTPEHRAAMSRTQRNIKHRAALARTFHYINNKDIVVQNIRTMKTPTNTLTAAENRDRFRALATVFSDHTA